MLEISVDASYDSHFRTIRPFYIGLHDIATDHGSHLHIKEFGVGPLNDIGGIVIRDGWILLEKNTGCRVSFGS